MKCTLRILAVLPLLALGACATIVEGTDQTVTLITDPAGAACTLTRQGVTVGAVNPTPGSVVLDKSKDDISIRCTKDGHSDGTGALSSSFRVMTIGNALFGGFLGVAVDSASGAMHEYPESVTILLTPEHFESAEARDAFFAGRKSLIEADAESALAKARESCKSDQQKCDALAAAITEQRDTQLRTLERRRKKATVEGE